MNEIPGHPGYVVWCSGDSKQMGYEAVVARMEPYKGRLYLFKDGQIIRAQDVTLSYDARFGPDVADVQEWNDLATRWSDEEDAKAAPKKDDANPDTPGSSPDGGAKGPEAEAPEGLRQDSTARPRKPPTPRRRR